MLKTLRYIFISLIIIVTHTYATAQTEPQKVVQEKQHGISVGVDLAPFIQKAFDPGRTGVGFTGRLTLKNKWFGIAEAGFESVKFADKRKKDREKIIDIYDYNSYGSYLRVGLDYDFFDVDEPGNNDNITLGMRYGFALQDHECPSFKIIDDYWGHFEDKISKNTVNSHWVEFVFGLRSEVLKNFYMGWTIRLRQIIAVNKNNILEPYTIPGYGRRDNSTNLGFTYTLEYQIPFGKKKRAIN
ncbi:hypothetical protein DMA11_02905 [Marinilabiliaceae bacterium JC017]|nr:hypothetical protein DMA11_02905 [Marinilabiliaceae bacterium JC017]